MPAPTTTPDPRLPLAPRRARGQGLVELAISVGLLMLLVMGLMNLGQLLLANYTVSQAARAAAHQAAITGGGLNTLGAAQAAADTAVAQVLSGGVGMRGGEHRVTVTCEAPCRRYSPMTVAVTFEQRYLAPVLALERFRIEATATRASERDAQ